MDPVLVPVSLRYVMVLSPTVMRVQSGSSLVGRTSQTTRVWATSATWSLGILWNMIGRMVLVPLTHWVFGELGSAAVGLGVGGVSIDGAVHWHMTHPTSFWVVDLCRTGGAWGFCQFCDLALDMPATMRVWMPCRLILHIDWLTEGPGWCLVVAFGRTLWLWSTCPWQVPCPSRGSSKCSCNYSVHNRLCYPCQNAVLGGWRRAPCIGLLCGEQ